MMRQLPLLLPHDEAMGADDFLVTPCNQEAAAWIDKWPDWFGVILSGLPGSGKTHLLTLWLTKSGGKLVPRDTLVAEDAFSLTAETPHIAIDNADALAGDAEAEENLFHLYNHLKEAKGSLLLTMKQPAGQVAWGLPDLRSRLRTLPVAPLLPPDDVLLEALIVKQFRDRQIAIDPGVVAYVARRAPRDAASVRNLVDRLDLAALAEGCKITIPLARKIMEADHDD
jgi:chromosomal replication initiation ATPase DnaA